MTKFISPIFFLIAAIVIVAHGDPDPACGNPDAKDCNSGCSCAHAPVCGNDGSTYNNRCRICCAFKDNNPRLRIQHPSSCKHMLPLDCPSGRDLVCGDDGQTYKNACLFKATSPCGRRFRSGPC